MAKVWLFLIVLLTAVPKTQAHPVAFKDSIGVMGHHSPTFSHIQINYSLRHWFALGIHHFNRPTLTDEDLHASFASLNFLLHRWNTSSFQANLYAIVGAGQSELSGQSQGAGLGLVQFDIEDRRLYFLAKETQILASGHKDFQQTIVRAGFAPYIEKYEGLHSWLIFEGERRRFSTGNYQEDLTPLLRLFYRNLLFEVGQSFKGHTKFNYIIHF